MRVQCVYHIIMIHIERTCIHVCVLNEYIIRYYRTISLLRCTRNDHERPSPQTTPPARVDQGDDRPLGENYKYFHTTHILYGFIL